MKCPDENLFLRYLAGRLPKAARRDMDDHLDDCPACRKVFSSMALTEHTDADPSHPSPEPTAGPQSAKQSSGPTVVLGNRYRIGEPLGRGGTGRVYAAEHLGTGRRCAIKFLSDSAAANPEAVERFSREARILGELEHKGIVSVLDFDEDDDGRPYLVMDLLEGEDLATRLSRQGALDWPTVNRLFRQLCQALREAHAHGVLHRDLKPSNIFLIPDDFGRDRPVLLDFGLAKHRALDPEGPQLTQTGTILGTPAYMSPEQALAHPVDERTDVYSLAAVLYQMLTGEAPFRGSSFTEVLAQLLTEPPPLLTRRTREVTPTHLDTVIQTAMDKDPKQRYASVAELERAVFGEGGLVATGTTAPSLGAQRNRGTIWLLVGGAAAALALGLGAYWYQSPPRPEAHGHSASASAPSVPVQPITDKGPSDAQAAPASRTAVPDPDTPASTGVSTGPTPEPGGQPRLRPRPRRRARPGPRRRPRPRTAATRPRKISMRPGDAYVTISDMTGKPVLRHLSQLSPARRALIRITVYMSRKDWKTCARIARKAPQTRQVLYYSIHCHYMLNDTRRTRKLCTQWRKRFPKEWKILVACLHLGHEFRTPP